MHPILADRKKLTIYLVIWVLAGFLCSAFFGSWFGVGTGGSILLAVPMLTLYGAMNLSSWFIARAFPFGRKNIGTILVALLASLTFVSGIWTVLCWGWLELVENILAVVLLPQRTGMMFLVVFTAGCELYMLSVSVSYLMSTVEASQAAERSAIQAQVLAQASELKALRMQINPHFLFNCLNSINALVVQDPEKARTMTTLLADFFRKSLQYGSRDSITLAEEISLLDNYLDIEKIRFGRRLAVEREVDQAALSVLVPPLILQPVLENAVKHGISGTIGGGTIGIRVERNRDRIFITLENPVDPDAVPKHGTGMGLQIVKKRLITLYGSDGDIQTFRDGTVFRTILFFPVKT